MVPRNLQKTALNRDLDCQPMTDPSYRMLFLITNRKLKLPFVARAHFYRVYEENVVAKVFCRGCKKL